MHLNGFVCLSTGVASLFPVVKRMSATEEEPKAADTPSLSPQAQAGDQDQGQTEEKKAKEGEVSEVSMEREIRGILHSLS